MHKIMPYLIDMSYVLILNPSSFILYFLEQT